MIDKRAYTETYNIINCLSEKSKEKIPLRIRKNIEDKMDKDYIFNARLSDLHNIKLLDDTEKLLSVLYTDYLSNDEEKKTIKAKEIAILREFEEEKKQYNKSEVAFNNKNINNKKEENDNDSLQGGMIEYEQNILNKLYNKVKNFINKFKNKEIKR